MMKRQINSLFFLAGMLVFALSLTSCEGTSQEGNQTDTEAKQDPGPQTGGIGAYSIRIVKTLDEDKATADGQCTTVINCYSQSGVDGDGTATIYYCSTNSTAADGTITFFINGSQVATGPAPKGTDGTPGTSNSFSFSGAINSFSYSATGSNGQTTVPPCN